MAKQPRKEVTSLRLEPKIKYLAEIASRVQRRNLTNYIEWVIEESLKDVHISEKTTINDVANQLWDIDESNRFASLALLYPELLTYEEQVFWKFINQFQYMIWINPKQPKKFSNFDFSTLNNNWEILKTAYAGDKEILSELQKKDANFQNLLSFE